MIDNTAALSHRGVKNRAVWKGENDWEKSPLTRPDIQGKQNGGTLAKYLAWKVLNSNLTFLNFQPLLNFLMESLALIKFRKG